MSDGVRFDGLCVTDFIQAEDAFIQEDEYRYRGYLRFYAEGWVVSTSVEEPATPQDVARWLNLQHPACPIGQYSLDEDALRFTVSIPDSIDYRDGTTAPGVHIEYTGVLEGNNLRLASRSHTTGHESEEEYRFYAVP